MQRAETLYAANPLGPDYYGGPTLAGSDPASQAAQRATIGYAMGPRPAALQGAAETSLVRGLSGEVNTDVFNPMVDALGSKMKSQLEGKVLPGIRQNLVEYQPGGGSRGDIVQANAIAAANQQMVNKAAEMYAGAYGSAQQRVPQAMGQYQSIMSAPMGLYGAVDQVGQQRQQMAQQGIDRDIAKYEYQQLAPQHALQSYMSGVSGDYGSSTTAPGPSGLAQLGQVAGIIGALSDARLKRNIEKLDINDVNLYSFNYVGNDAPHIGVMAQEHEEKVVGEIDGYKVVNYADFIPMMMHSIQVLTSKVDDLTRRLDN